MFGSALGARRVPDRRLNGRLVLLITVCCLFTHQLQWITHPAPALSMPGRSAALLRHFDHLLIFNNNDNSLSHRPSTIIMFWWLWFATGTDSLLTKVLLRSKNKNKKTENHLLIYNFCRCNTLSHHYWRLNPKQWAFNKRPHVEDTVLTDIRQPWVNSSLLSNPTLT